MQRILISLFMSLLIFVVCECSNDPVTTDPDTPLAPEKTNDGWETATPEAVGMNPDTLLAMIDEINSYPNHGIHSVLIVKDNKLVFEKYFLNRDYKSLPPQTLDNYVQYTLSSPGCTT